MSGSVSARVLPLVSVLVGARAELWRWRGGRGVPLGVAASWVGVADGTFRSWERGRTVPSLRFVLRWGAVFGYRMVLVDHRGLRWDQGVGEFEPSWRGDRDLLDRFAGAELRRLGVGLRRARGVWGLSVRQVSADVGCADEWNRVRLWEHGEQFPGLELFTRWADRLGLRACLEPVDRLPDEVTATGYLITALRPDRPSNGQEMAR